MKTKIIIRKLIFLSILYFLVATFTYLYMLDPDGQEYIGMIVGFVSVVSIFVYIIKTISKGAKEVLDEYEENYYAVGYLFIRIKRVTELTMLYAILQGFSFPTDYSIAYGVSIFLPSFILFLWSYSVIDDINNMRKYGFKGITRFPVILFFNTI